MQDYETKLLEKYPIDPDSVRKVRGAVWCHAKQESYLLKEVHVSAERITALQKLHKYLMESGYDKVDEIIPNQDGEYITVLENGRKYILKHWFDGRECDYRKPAEVLEASTHLAKLHGYLQIPEEKLVL